MIRNLLDKLNFNTLSRKQSIILSITGIALIMLTLTGLTYGYFVTRIQGNTSNKSISISTENLELTYGDGNGSISATNFKPDTTISKTFTVSNTGTGTVVGYGIFLEDVVNTFERTTDLQLKVTCDSSLYGNGACNAYEGASPYQNDYLLQNTIEKGETHTYTLTLTYIEAGVDQSVDMGKEYSAKVQIYSTGETVDLEGSITNYAKGDYVVVNSTPKKSFIRSNNTFKVVGLLPGSHTIEVYAKDASTPKLTKTFTIKKGDGTNSGTTVYINDLTRTITTSLNVTSKEFTITGVSESLPLSPDSLGGKILANGATYVTSWTEGLSYYQGTIYEEGYPGDGITLYTPNATTNEKLIKTSDAYGDSADNGLFMAEDDYGITYYYKGSIVNNYIEFAGLDWRIVRINGDGSVRLILADTTKNLGIGENSKFNVLYNDDAYVGYMYGLVSNQTSNYFDDTHKNINDSTIKTNVDLFYETYLKDDYSTYLADTLFCADKTNDYELGEFSYDDYWGYFFNKRMYYGTQSISFKCAEGATNTYSRYTANSVATSKQVFVNDDLDYPIGLLSGDEYILAGNSFHAENNKNYLINVNETNALETARNQTIFWLMSPLFVYVNSCSYNPFNSYYFIDECGEEAFVASARMEASDYISEADWMSGVRPVINIKAGIKVLSGDGTEGNPYKI